MNVSCSQLHPGHSSRAQQQGCQGTPKQVSWLKNLDLEVCAPSHSKTTTAMRMRAENGCLEDFALLNDLWILQLDKLQAPGGDNGMWGDTSPWVSWAKLSDNNFGEMGELSSARLPFNFQGQTVGTREFRTWPSARSGAAMSFIDNTPNYETLVNMAH